MPFHVCKSPNESLCVFADEDEVAEEKEDASDEVASAKGMFFLDGFLNQHLT